MKALLLVAACLIAVPSFSQVDIESQRLDVLRPIHGTVGGSFSIRSGNVDFYAMGLDGRLDMTAGGNDFLLIGNIQQLQSAGDVVSQTRFGHARYNRDLTTWWGLEVFGQAEYDEARLLNSRILAGSGFRFRAFRNDRMTLYVGTTPMVEFEELSPDAGITPLKSTVGRLSNYLNLRASRGDAVQFSHAVYLQPRFGALSDYRLLNNTSVDFKIWANLRMGIRLHIRHDNEPVPGLDRFDMNLSNSLSVDL